ncbi:hypothetical protein SAMN05421848_3014 [Kushneria avicenniae]|uniref:Uncharacterized protein n=1 Tax=Kushneria avicenniae TaxID=402385 RepID=A0A1I1MTE4_9GAMM|nr:hypothetical protein [Kushneria avicenniae]SFC85863.1 hypothetical protein SAMN05421848_3014 [Kushneria avicenniae]
MKASRMALWGLILTLVPVLALATAPPEDDSATTPPSQSMEAPDQNPGGMSRPGGASGMEDQSGSMQRERQKQLDASHASPSGAGESQDQSQEAGKGSMNDDHTPQTERSAGEIPDERTQDDTAP